MRFRDWVQAEGFYADIPNNLRGQLHSLRTGQRKAKKTAIQDLHNVDFVRYSPEDHPEDFISVEPVFAAKELQEMPITGGRLPSFENGKIYYGFQFKTKAGIKDEDSVELDQHVKTLRQEYRRLEKERKIAVDKKGGISQAQADAIEEVHQRLMAKGWDSSQIDRLPPLVNRALEEKGLKPLTPKKIVSHFSRRKEEAEADPRTIRKRMKQIEAEIEELKSAREAKGQRTNAIQQGFIKKLKNPQSYSDIELQDQFIKMAVDHYLKFRTGAIYDYIVYPESSSEFNEKLANALAKALPPAKAIRGLTKLPEPRWDTHNIFQSGPKQYADLKSAEPDVRRNQWQQVQKWAHVTQGRDNAPLQIKNVRQDFRPWIKNLQINPELGQQRVDPDPKAFKGFRGKRVLLVDDNVASSGTFQASHKILHNQGARKIDMYTPLWVTFHS